MPLVVTQLPSVYGKNLSLTGAVYYLAKKTMLLWCIHNLKLMTTI